MAVYYVGDNNPDGMSLGFDADEKISFYGVSPVAQQTVTQQSAQTTTALRTDLDALLSALHTVGVVNVAET